MDRVEELVGVPGGGQRSGLGLPVADDADGQQTGVVERRAVRVRQGIAQLTALVDGAGGLRGDMAGHPAGEGELPEEPGHARRVPAHVRVDVGVTAVQPGPGQHGGPAVAGAPDADRVQVAGADGPAEVGVDEVQTGRGAPVAEQPRLDVLGAQRFGEQGVGEQIDLADREVVRGAPVGVQGVQFVLGGVVGAGGVVQRRRGCVGHGPFLHSSLVFALAHSSRYG